METRVSATGGELGRETVSGSGDWRRLKTTQKWGRKKKWGTEDTPVSIGVRVEGNKHRGCSAWGKEKPVDKREKTSFF